MMSDQYPGYVLEIERTFDAPAQEVFDAWTSEEVLRRWFHGTPNGRRRPPRSTCGWAAACGS
jgi:uncharacterized protein YndB with AHSA1/START domain